jgi:uncharacterized membrane protein
LPRWLLYAIIVLKGEIVSLFFRGARNIFIRGLLAILPVAATFYLLWLVYRLFVKLVDAIFGPLLTGILGSHWWITGVGIFLTIFVVWLIGLMTWGYVGRAFHRYFEGLLERVPLVNKTYAMAKQVTAALFRADVPAFKQVVLFEYPRKGVYTLGFITSESPGRLGRAIDGEFISVYAPTSPNPLSGWLLLIPTEEVIYPELSVEEGLKLILSGGVLIPDLKIEEEPPLRRPWRWFHRKQAKFEPTPQEDYNEEQ